MLPDSIEDEYCPDYGFVVVIDPTDPGRGLDRELLTDSEIELPTGGTVAHAGAGWLWGRGGSVDDPCHFVRMEAYDVPRCTVPGGMVTGVAHQDAGDPVTAPPRRLATVAAVMLMTRLCGCSG